MSYILVMSVVSTYIQCVCNQSKWINQSIIIYSLPALQDTDASLISEYLY